MILAQTMAVRKREGNAKDFPQRGVATLRGTKLVDPSVWRHRSNDVKTRSTIVAGLENRRKIAALLARFRGGRQVAPWARDRNVQAHDRPRSLWSPVANSLAGYAIDNVVLWSRRARRTRDTCVRGRHK